MSANDKLKHHVPITLVAGVFLLLLARGYFWLSGTVIADEAYYWLWGQHPAVSYFDHPPLNAWALFLASKFFGWGVIALRIIPALTFALDIWLLWLISRQLSDKPKSHFWVTTIVFVSTPIFQTMTIVSLPDNLLICLLLAAFYFFIRFFKELSESRPTTWRLLYLACALTGLATLAKYNAVLLGVGVFLYAVFNTKARKVFSSWHSYAAAALFVLILSPEIYWNFTTSGSSVSFILSSRHAGLATDDSFSGLIGYLGGIIAFLSVFLIWPLFKLMASKVDDAATSVSVSIGRTVFWCSTLVFFIISLQTDVMFHWNLVAYIMLLPLIALHIQADWLLVCHIIYGLMIALVVIFNFSVVPIRSFFSSADYFSARSFGWSQTAERASELREEYKVDFIAGTHYTVSAQLGFAMQSSEVTDLGTAKSQFSFWLMNRNLNGKNALIVSNNSLPSEITNRFMTSRKIDSIEIRRFGYFIENRHFFYAEGFKN